MDILLITVIFAIIVTIGYILSRPFMNAETMNNTSSINGEYSIKYQMLLSEIKNLEDECLSAENPEHACEQLEDKKQQAANLLRKIYPPENKDLSSTGAEPAVKQSDTQPERDLSREVTLYCPQCGSQVLHSDKFCTHCGQSLRP